MQRSPIARNRCPAALLWAVGLVASLLPSAFVMAQNAETLGIQASERAVQSSAEVCAETGAATCHCSSGEQRVSRSAAKHILPNVTLINANGQTVLLSDAFSDSHPIVMQFAFTSCSTICPVASATMAKVQKDLGIEAKQVRFCTISIDPQYDTPERLAEFARKLEAADGWIFLTGEPQDIAAVQKAFSAYVPNKSRHEPLTFLRAARSDRWIRITGLISATSLLGEVRDILSSGAD